MIKQAKSNGHDKSLEEMARILNSGSGVAVQDLPAPVQDQASTVQAPVDGIIWKRKGTAHKKTTIINCIVIDKYDHWHTATPVDLQGMDTSTFTWGYYGFNYPVLVEQDKGELKPFYLPDSAGESSNRLFKAANPDGFKATFKHKSNLLTKIQVGLMVALVLGLFFIMFIFLGWK